MQFFLKWCSVIKEDTSWYVRKVWGEEKHCRTLWLGLRVSVSLCHWLLLKGFLRVLFFPLDESQVGVPCHLSLLYLEEGSVISYSPSWGILLAMLKYVTHRLWWTASFLAGFILKNRIHIHHSSLWKFSLLLLQRQLYPIFNLHCEKYQKSWS